MLASPIIEGTLPAFYCDENGTAQIAVPFSMSRAVRSSEVREFVLKIKNIQGTDYLMPIHSSEVDYNNSIVIFTVPQVTLESLRVGSFYKAQIAYVNLEGVTGHYSPVGIIKYTTKPIVKILDLKETWNNAHIYNYTGVYSQYKKDATEKAYSYRFEIKDSDGVVVEDTGFIVHNNSEDDKYYESRDNFTFTSDLEENKKYTITYTVITNNKLEVSTAPYKIMSKKSIESDLHALLVTELNYNNGYVDIYLIGEKDENGFETPVRGSFLLARASEDSDYKDWEKIAEFSLASQKPSSKRWKDFTIKQGVKYRYSVQQYNREGLYSERIMSSIKDWDKNTQQWIYPLLPIYTDFEDSFLYDGTRQLKIKFNPKVASFKKDIFEAKVDTLGSKYPFIFKNGNVEYKEFNIAGLISYLMDDENLFYNNKDLYFNQERHEGDKYVPYYPTKRWSTFPVSGLTEEEIVTPVKEPESNYKDRAKEYGKNYLFYYVYVPDNNGEYKYERWVTYALENPDYGFSNVVDIANWDKVYYIFRSFEHNLYNKLKVKGDIFNPKTELKTTNEVSYNIFREREFKLEVLNWLTNGEPKLFKSPTEGNYIVRLMNVSLTPEDQLGRMLHNFSCTAYEVADMNYESLLKYNIIQIEPGGNKYLKVMTIPLSTTDENFVNLNKDILNYVLDGNTGIYYITGNLLKAGVNPEHALLYDMAPGTEILVDNESILIGGSGTYEIPTKVSQITLPAPQKSNGLLTISYIAEFNDSFNLITKTDIREVLGHQFIGRYDDVLNEVENIETNIVTFYDIQLFKRPMKSAYCLNDYIKVDQDKITYANYKEYYILKDGEYIPAERYSIQITYYEPVLNIYEDLNYTKLIATFRLKDNESPKTLKRSEQIDPLATYTYYRDKEEVLNMPLYRKIIFSDIDNQDKLDLDPTNKIRDWNNRSATNPYLKDLRDYDLMAYSGQLYTPKLDEITGEIIFEQVAANADFNSKDIYFIAEQIPIIFDPKEPWYYYLDKATHQAFKDLWSELKRKFDLNNLALEDKFNSNFKRFNYYAYINSEPFNLTEIESYKTGPIGLMNSLQLEAGLYCNLYYQAQDIYYNVDQIFQLKNEKEWLTNARYQLTKDYMIQQCIESDNEDDYIKLLKEIYDTYPRRYKAYVALLTAYINSLKEEG